MGNLKFHKKLHYAKIPDGYQWCEECEMLMPFRSFLQGTWKRTVCSYCGNPANYDGCDNCNAQLPEVDGVSMRIFHEPGCHFRLFGPDDTEFKNREFSWDGDANRALQVIRDFRESWMKQAPEVGSGPRFVQLMNKGRIKFLKDRYEEEFNRECNCPERVVYSAAALATLHCNTRPYVSMDCMNAHTWDYAIRCHICGFVNHRQDDSC